MARVLKTNLAVLITLMLGFSSNIVQGAPLFEELDIQLIKVQFAVLHTTSPTSLDSEAWFSSDDERNSALNELQRLNNETASNPYDMQAPQAAIPQDLLQTLTPLTSRGRFKVLTSTQWTQPSSKKHTQIISSAVNTFGDYDLVFGELGFEERNTFLARLSLKLVNQNSLAPKTQATPEPGYNTAINQNPLYINQIDEHNTNAQSLADTSSAKHPIIFIEQQRQIRLNQIHYFDHPVTPAFLLVSRVTQD